MNFIEERKKPIPTDKKTKKILFKSSFPMSIASFPVTSNADFIVIFMVSKLTKVMTCFIMFFPNRVSA